jgi:nitroreductase
MPDFFDVVLGQRACRDFLPDEVPEADIERMLEAATHAPSAENRQPWVFVVVTDPARRAAITDAMAAAWAAVGAADAEGHLGASLKRDVDRGMNGGFATAPVLVVVAVDRDLTGRGSPSSSIWPAVQNLLLAANALGYGSALTNLAVYAADLTGLLELPETVTPVAVVPIGRPARPLGPARRRPAADVTYRDGFGRRS